MHRDQLGVLKASKSQEQDLVIVSRGPARPGRVLIGSVMTNSIVGEVDVEILEGNVVVTVRRADESYFGPVSMVVV